MLDKLRAVENRFDELCFKSEQPDFYADPQKAAKLLRERNDLEPIIEVFRAYRCAEQDMKDAEELMSDPEMKELCQETYATAKALKEELFEKLRILLLQVLNFLRRQILAGHNLIGNAVGVLRLFLLGRLLLKLLNHALLRGKLTLLLHETLGLFLFN